MSKKRILIHSNHWEMFTGFGKHTKNLLSYLYKTGKYEIIQLSNGFQWSDENIKTAPWKTYGSLPDDTSLLQEINQDQRRAVACGYGAEMIDHAIYKLKPDIYLGIEDIWAFNNFFEKPWWNKIHCVVHTTLDSLPILPDAVSAAPKIKNYFVWSSFAEKALHKLGHTHVKTIRGTLNTKDFFRLSDSSRSELRSIFKTSDSFVIGFVFRNQLRKSVPNLLDGFQLFDRANPQANAKLFLHTHWSEGWDIMRLLNEKGIDLKKILTTYFCKKCSRYDVRSFAGQNIQCRHCKTPNSCETTNIKNGVNEQQLNEIYNLMDVYCHPFTSGGQEIPIQEAKLTELITLVTNYSCGEDTCTLESGGLPLEWAEYREPGTQFIKASTLSSSICSNLEKVYNMHPIEKRKMEQNARQFVIDNFSIEKVGKQFEDLFDSLPSINYDFNEKKQKANPLYQADESLSNPEWVRSLYEKMLYEIDEQGIQHWIHRLDTDLSRKDVLNYFKQVSFSKNIKIQNDEILENIKNDPFKKRIAFIQPHAEEEIISCCSILPSIKEAYPEYEITFFTKREYFDLVDANPFIDKLLEYSPKMDDPLFFEGKGDIKKYFDIVFSPYLSIRNNFFRNAKDKIQFDLHEYN